MPKDDYSEARRLWKEADRRLEASEREFSALFMNCMFGPNAELRPPQKSSPRPCVNVTPPKQPPKK